MKYNFGLRGHDIADNFSDMCLKAKENNIQKLQFALAKTVTEINFDEIGYNPELSKKINNELKKHDLHVSVLGCYISPVASDKDVLKTHLERFRNFLYYAKDFGADMIGTETPGKATREESHSEETYLEFIENIRPIVKEAEKLGVTVGIEPVYANCISSPQRTKRMLDDLNSDNVAVILDISNMIYPETKAIQCDIINDSFDLFGDKIKAIHVKDFAFDGDNKSFAVAGTGELMTELLFDRINMLPHTPELILDTTPLDLYKDSLIALENILAE